MIAKEIPQGWTADLAVLIAASLQEFCHKLGDVEVVRFSVGCFPWHGTLELSMLTAKELDDDPTIGDPTELAAWNHYDFGASFAAWGHAENIGRRMKEVYYAASDADRGSISDEFFKACAAATTSIQVSESLAMFNRDHRFRPSVTHPDDGREFCAL